MRAMNKGTRYGRKEQEENWKNAEVDALYQLANIGLGVPKPFGYLDDVQVMQLITTENGDPAPRLGEVDLSAELALKYHHTLIRQVPGMLSLGLIHGDLSGFLGGRLRARKPKVLCRRMFLVFDALAGRTIRPSVTSVSQ